MPIEKLAEIDIRPDTVIDYNLRRRGGAIEADRQLAITELKKLIEAHKSLDGCATEAIARQKLTIIAEVSIDEEQSVSCTSNLIRELIFVAMHAIHHYALVKMMATHRGLPVPSGFGIAPATATFLRGER